MLGEALVGFRASQSLVIPCPVTVDCYGPLSHELRRSALPCAREIFIMVFRGSRALALACGVGVSIRLSSVNWLSVFFL
jgi:hypothetical protein